MITGRRFLFEADDDATSGANTNDTAATNNDTAANDNNAESSDSKESEGNAENDNNQNNEENNQDEKKEENKEEEKDPDDFNDDDFTIDDNDKNDEEKEESSDSTDNSFGGGDDNEEHKADPDSLKAKDRELFDILSIEEQQIKVKELKKQFGDLYSNTVSLVDRFNEISTEMGNSSLQVNKVIAILFELKSMISFYVLNIYDIKSYVENDIVFNRYLSIFNNIKQVMNTIKNEEFSDK